MTTWMIWFVIWLVLGFTLFAVVTKVTRTRYWLASGSRVMLVWILCSAVAAEVTRYYLTIAPFPPLVWEMAGLGVAIVGAVAGLASGWFIGGPSFGRAADILSGILGASIAAWAEITSSYNHFGCAAAVVLVGPVFATLALRLYARSKLPLQKFRTDSRVSQNFA